MAETYLSDVKVGDRYTRQRTYKELHVSSEL